MAYSFDIIGVSPVLNFFTYQQQVERNPHRARAYLGSYVCTLDGFIESTELVAEKPDWDWDDVVSSIVNFWLGHGDSIRHWQKELAQATDQSLIVARVANFEVLRDELEGLFD